MSAATLTMSTLPIQTFTKSYQEDLVKEVKRRKEFKVLRKKVLKQLKKETPTIKPVKTKVKSKKALKKAAEKAAEKEVLRTVRLIFKAHEKREKNAVKAAAKEAKQRETLLKKIDAQNYRIQFDREGASIETLRRINREIPNCKRADAKLDKENAARAKTIETLKKQIRAANWAIERGLSLQEFVVALQDIMTELHVLNKFRHSSPPESP